MARRGEQACGPHAGEEQHGRPGCNAALTQPDLRIGPPGVYRNRAGSQAAGAPAAAAAAESAGFVSSQSRSGTSPGFGDV